MKGIILAAGKGTRLYPMTKSVCKPLLPVYDKPLIYYPLALLLQAGCDEVLIIIPPGEEAVFSGLLGDGSNLGLRISYEVQKVARGIADALIIGENFIGGDRVCLALGDNIFYSKSLAGQLQRASAISNKAVVFGYWVEDPRAFGVIEFDSDGNAISIEEKPKNPKSNYIVPGLYFYDASVVEIAKNLKPSARGELEITDVNLEYLRQGRLQVIGLDRDTVWLDAGTADSMHEASGVIRKIQEETGRYVGCIEEDALHQGKISPEKVMETGERLQMTLYGQYLKCIALAEKENLKVTV